MKDIPDGSVDLILCDLPYGTTECEWDRVIPFDLLWAQYNRILKPNGPVVLFATQPFATDLINSNRRAFRYEWVWEKDKRVGFLNAKKMPLRVHELILVFYRKLPTYNPQMWEGTPYIKARTIHSDIYGNQKNTLTINDGKRYPVDVLKFGKSKDIGLHPTQKPVALLEYLVRTYTNEGDTVLDNCMGSGSTGVAVKRVGGRHFIGIEQNQNYFDIARERIEKEATP